MKKLICGLFTFVMFGAKAQNSGLSIENGTVKFSTIEIYESYADNQENLNSLKELSFSSSELTTLKEIGNTSDDDIPEFLQSILNYDNIFTIGSYLIKIDVDNNRALVINSSVTNAYFDLVNNNTSSNDMLVMSDDEQNALDVLNAIENATLTAGFKQVATDTFAAALDCI